MGFGISTPQFEDKFSVLKWQLLRRRRSNIRQKRRLILKFEFT
jgi:hypothetical protein